MLKLQFLNNKEGLRNLIDEGLADADGYKPSEKSKQKSLFGSKSKYIDAIMRKLIINGEDDV